MTSRKLELLHEKELNKLLADSKLDCERAPPESTESSMVEGELEEALGHMEEEEQIFVEEVLEEEQKPVEEQVPEAINEVFPTPSLRRVIPDKIRKHEEYNRIHVLPEEFNTYIDPQAIPKIASTAPKKYIEIIADLVGCTMYHTSLPEYWFLDTMANLLRRAQEDELHRPTQAILMLWFCEWMKEMQQFDAADRLRMMRRFKENMLAASQFIAEEEMLPTPEQAGVYYKQKEVTTEPPHAAASETISESKITLHTHSGYQCSLQDLTKIIHYIYDLFSTDYQYELVRSVFTDSPDYVLIDAPEQLQVPKKMYTKLKPVKQVKKVVATPKGKKKQAAIEYTEDYLHLMEVKAKEEKALAEQEEEDREIWNRRSSILPLSFIPTTELFNKYWPPPPPPVEEKPPEPEPVEPKKSKKKK